MPPRLVLQFLGLPQIYLDEKPVVTDRRKAVALLAYLAVNDIGHKHQRYTRESLSALMWPDYEQAKAFSNLRRTIWEIHQAIGESWLVAEREAIQLNPNAEIDLDVARFQNFLSQSDQQTNADLRIPLLVESTKLYRNHFLTGFSLKDAYPFNEWAFAESEELRQKLVGALMTLSEDYCALGQAEKSLTYAQRLVALDPLDESAHRQLMEVYLQAGQHSAALKQYQTCEQILRKELNLDPQPETRALYKKIRKGEAKPLQLEQRIETSRPKHNLPGQLSSFIGREKEKEEITTLLTKNRLVTLAGAGGIGKTRLSLQVGQKLLNNYPDGVWFIPLDSLSDPALVPASVAAVFDIREGSSDEPLLERLIYSLHSKTTLLIFDNCEHLLDACAQLITTLLTHCSNLKVLTTSREVLELEGEAVYYVPSLSIPTTHGFSPTENLAQYQSVRLFVQRAQLAQTHFSVTAENAPFLIEICQVLNGIPLALELAAAHVDILQLKELWKQLKEHFDLLVSNLRAAIPRHQTMRASLNWSWGLLSKEEQTFMGQLSVFAGGWTLESAKAVCDDNALNLISALVKKSLITVEQEAGRETRYRFHEIVRQYAQEKLVESSEEENIRTRHLKYFLQFSEQAEVALKGPSQIEWQARLHDERDNIRIALEWADKTDVEKGLYICGYLVRYWEDFNLSEGHRWLPKFSQKPESLTYPHARAKALCALAWSLQWMEQFDQARAVAQECLDLYRSCGDKYGEIDALTLLGTISNWQVSPDMDLFQQALSQARSLKDTWRQAQILGRMGQLVSSYQKRVSYWEKAISLFRKTGDIFLVCGFTMHLADFEMAWGNTESARIRLNEALRLNREKSLGGEKNLSFLSILGRISSINGDFQQARVYLQSAVNISEDQGHRMNTLWLRTKLGYLALQEGKIDEARDLFAETAPAFQKDKNLDGSSFTLEGLARYYVIVSKLNRAARLVGWADATRKKINHTRPPIEQADVDKIIAACLTQMGEVAFSDAYEEGQSMTLDEVVAYALKED